MYRVEMHLQCTHCMGHSFADSGNSNRCVLAQHNKSEPLPAHCIHKNQEAGIEKQKGQHPNKERRPSNHFEHSTLDVHLDERKRDHQDAEKHHPGVVEKAKICIQKNTDDSYYYAAPHTKAAKAERSTKWPNDVVVVEVAVWVMCAFRKTGKVS